MARKKTAPATDAERLADSVNQCLAAIDDIRRRLGEAERKLDELRHLPLTVLALREDVAALKAQAKPWTLTEWLRGK